MYEILHEGGEEVSVVNYILFRIQGVAQDIHDRCLLWTGNLAKEMFLRLRNHSVVS